MDQLEGGFVIHRTNPILMKFNKHTAGLPGRPISETDLEATNRLQRTAWAVNQPVLGVAKALLHERGCDVVPTDESLPLPARTPDDIWAGLSPKEQKEIKRAAGKIHRENASRLGRRSAFGFALETATEMSAHPAMWFPWMKDFRTRRYPAACGGLSVQGPDHNKALLRFARRKPLGDTGLYWLAVHAANCWGHDKIDLDARVGWVFDNAALFERIAADPTRWRAWGEYEGKPTEAPWQCLAAALDLAAALRAPEAHESGLPVGMDGSCNGLQHLSAMGLDPIGARATNLCDDPVRHDIYLEVRDAALALVRRDAEQGNPVARLWLDHVNRAAVKRAVLSTPYGVTDEGIRRQLVKDDIAPESPEVSAKDSSAYFRDILVAALSGTVVAAKLIMAWLQDVAKALAEAGLPLVWQTPAGSTICQAYRVCDMRRVETLAGRTALLVEDAQNALDPVKAALGSAPNVVHSFDAAHLALTVNAMGRLYGIEDFAMVHDSYGTHAADITTMNAVLRSEFVDMYRVNWLERLYRGFQQAAPHVVIPTPPERGDFDLEANVPNSRFFFA